MSIHNKVNIPLENAKATYISNFITKAAAQSIYQSLIEEYNIPNLKIKHGNYTSFFGKLMFVDQVLYELDALKFHSPYTAIWSKELLKVKQKVEALTNQKFATCVCIYYPDGNSGIDFHYDPPAFGDTMIIPSLSLGEERMFYLKKKEATENAVEIVLEDGSLFIMGEHCQTYYEHCQPTDPKYKNPRINITFRQYKHK